MWQQLNAINLNSSLRRVAANFPPIPWVFHAATRLQGMYKLAHMAQAWGSLWPCVGAGDVPHSTVQLSPELVKNMRRKCQLQLDMPSYTRCLFFCHPRSCILAGTNSCTAGKHIGLRPNLRCGTLNSITWEVVSVMHAWHIFIYYIWLCSSFLFYVLFLVLWLVFTPWVSNSENGGILTPPSPTCQITCLSHFLEQNQSCMPSTSCAGGT